MRLFPSETAALVGDPGLSKKLLSVSVWYFRACLLLLFQDKQTGWYGFLYLGMFEHKMSVVVQRNSQIRF